MLYVLVANMIILYLPFWKETRVPNHYDAVDGDFECILVIVLTGRNNFDATQVLLKLAAIGAFDKGGGFPHWA